MNWLLRCATTLCLIAVSAPVGARDQVERGQPAPDDQRFGAYANLRTVVFEPSEDNPQRVRISGAFSVSASGGNYQLRERGYLYFRLPADPAGAIQDWRVIKQLSEDRPDGWQAAPGTRSFLRPGVIVRVRTVDEPPTDPDVYVPGPTPRRVSSDYGSPLGERIMKPPHTLNYARVDDVVLNPPTAPQSIQVRGAFSLARADGSYGAPQVGYLYLSLSRDQMVEGTEWLFRGSRGAQWADWKAVAGKRQVVKFLRYAHGQLAIRVRATNEPLGAPDSYAPISLQPPFAVRSDTLYRPVRALLDAR